MAYYYSALGYSLHSAPFKIRTNEMAKIKKARTAFAIRAFEFRFAA
jgi:hypothetical protein